MRRARRLVAQAGLEVIPAPTEIAVERDGALQLFDFPPSTAALQQRYYALHEWLDIAQAELLRLRQPAGAGQWLG